MFNSTSNRSDSIKIMATVLPQAVVFTLIWIRFMSWFSMFGICGDTIFQLLILFTLSFFPILIGNILLINGEICLERERSIHNVFFSSLSHSITIILIILYFQTQNPDIFPIIGHVPNTTIQVLDILVSSIFLFLLLSILFGIIQKSKHQIPIDGGRTEYLNRKFLLFETPGERIMAIIMVVLQVISEELIYRGYLINYLGAITNQYLLLSFISVSLIVVGHLYQGRDKIVNHLLLSILLAITVYIYKTIFISITIHLLINLSYTFSVWRRKGKDNN